VKTTLDGVDQRDYLEGKSEKSAHDTFFYYTGATPSARRQHIGLVSSTNGQ
jgi:arylsulfatase